MITAPLANALGLDRSARSSRGLQFVAVCPDGSPLDHLFKTAAPAVAATPGAVGAVVIQRPALAMVIAPPPQGS